MDFVIPVLNEVYTKANQKGIELDIKDPKTFKDKLGSDLFAGIKKTLDAIYDKTDMKIPSPVPVANTPEIQFWVAQNDDTCKLVLNGTKMFGRRVAVKNSTFDFPVYVACRPFDPFSDIPGTLIFVIEPNFICGQLLEIKKKKRLSISPHKEGKNFMVYRVNDFVFVKDLDEYLTVYNTTHTGNKDLVKCFQFERVVFDPHKSKLDSFKLSVNSDAFSRCFVNKTAKFYKTATEKIMMSFLSNFQKELLGSKYDNAQYQLIAESFVNDSLETTNLVRKVMVGLLKKADGTFPDMLDIDDVRVKYDYSNGRSILKVVNKDNEEVTAVISWTGKDNPYDRQFPFKVFTSRSRISYTGEFLGQNLELSYTGKLVDGTELLIRNIGKLFSEQVNLSMSKNGFNLRILADSEPDKNEKSISICLQRYSNYGTFEVNKQLPDQNDSLDMVFAKPAPSVINADDSVYINMEKEVFQMLSKSMLTEKTSVENTNEDECLTL